MEGNDYLWEKLEPLQKVELEKYNIFLKAYDVSGDSRLTMNEFKKIVLTKNPELRDQVVQREPKIQGNFGVNDFSEKTSLLLKKLWQAHMELEISVVEVKDSEYPLNNFEIKEEGILSSQDLRKILTERGILKEEK